MLGRLFEITYILIERGAVTARELAERFEVTVRTIYRDVEQLSAAGIPVYMERGRNGGLRLMRDFVLDKTVLTQAEKDTILSSLAGLSATGREEYGDALNKLAALFGSAGPDWIEVDFSGWGWSGVLKDRFALIKNAVLQKRVVTFDYHGTRGSGYRTAEPLKLVFKGQSWYVYAFCRDREDCRFFKLSRMENTEMTDETFERIAPEKVIKSEKDTAAETVFVRFAAAASAAFLIHDAYPMDVIEPRPDGSLIVSTSIPKGDWLVPYFLSFQAQIEILEPQWLKEQLQKTLETMLRRYKI